MTHALANGGFTDRELAAPAPAKATQYTRRVDHELSWALTNLKRQGVVENPERGVWQLSGNERRDIAPAGRANTEGAIDAQRLRDLRAMPYVLYLRTPEWQRTRADALRRAGYRCSLDATHRDRLEVHHRTYERLGAERARDVIVLCHDCHRLHHESYGSPRRPRLDDAQSRPHSGGDEHGRPASRSKGSLLQRLLGLWGKRRRRLRQ